MLSLPNVPLRDCTYTLSKYVKLNYFSLSNHVQGALAQVVEESCTFIFWCDIYVMCFDIIMKLDMFT